MAISLSAVKGTPFTAFARAMRRSGARRQLLTESPPVNMGGDLGSGGINGVGLTGSYSWRLIAPAARLTITFTCWPAWCRPDEAQPT